MPPVLGPEHDCGPRFDTHWTPLLSSAQGAGARRNVGSARPKALGSHVLDADQCLVGPDHLLRMVSEYCDGDNVYHSCGEEGGTAGVPSGFFFTGEREGTLVMHCFACGICHFVLPVANPVLFDCRTDLRGLGKLELSDVSDTFMNKFTVVF
jgi:hypothetical protein